MSFFLSQFPISLSSSSLSLSSLRLSLSPLLRLENINPEGSDMVSPPPLGAHVGSHFSHQNFLN